jgi:hypothetical protein
METQTLTTNIQKAGKIIFILATAAFTSTILLFYSYLLKDLVPSTNMLREYVICFGQIFFQVAIILFFHRKYIVLDYLQQMMTVSFIGALLLLPGIVSNIILFPFSPGSIYFLAYFFVIVLFMFFDHKRRIKKIEAPHWLTYTWVLYRIIVLLIIL